MKKRSKVLINCSNSHIGGAVAVASSFIYCISQKEYTDVEISILASSAVNSNLIALGVDLSRFSNFTVLDYFGIKSLWQGLDRHFKNQDVVFTVFGPCYFLRKKTFHICGFAQPWIIYPNNPVEKNMKMLSRLRLRLKCAVQEVFFSRVDELIVELGHVKVRLSNKWLFKKILIHIVNSSVDEIFKHPSRWHPVNIPVKSNALRLGIISRNYPHKNLACLPYLKEHLKKMYDINAEFFITFSDKEWTLCSENFKRNINNIGSLSLTQCPSFYSAMDGVIFPSLLECFSAVPIEGMMMQKPVFASNLPFIVDCCHEHVIYFEPGNVDSMAKSISEYFKKGKSQQEDYLKNSHSFVSSYPDAIARANIYMEIIGKCLAYPKRP
jgi:hypothetical protein